MKRLSKYCCLFVVMVLIACSNDKDKANNEPAVANKNVGDVEVTLPAVMFKNQDIDKVIENAKLEGIKDVIKHDDGSLTYKMSKSVYDDTLKEFETNIGNIVGEAKKKIQSVKDVTYEQNLSKFTFVVDRKSFENSLDGLVTYTLGILALNYQYFTGSNLDDAKVSISIKDEKTGEAFSVMEFPDVLDELNQDENEK